MTGTNADERWPPLPLDAWQDTYATLHMWMQIVGKIRLALTPRINQWWNAALQLTVRGIGTGPMSCGKRVFEIEFEFVDHRLRIACADGAVASLALRPQAVADFYNDVMSTLAGLGLDVQIWPVPVEMADPIPFAEDRTHAAYDPDYANRCWRVLLHAARELEAFRAGFRGKCSPVHFFWGSFDLAVTRFSGRPAAAREGADAITREAYSEEVISHGFWPGTRPTGGAADSGIVSEPAFYAYAAPEPASLSQAAVRPAAAYYNDAMKEFILPYEAMRTAPMPERALREFLESTYAAAADRGGWPRERLERPWSQSSA